MIKDSLVESGSVPGGIFGSHRQKVSPTGDAFSYFVSGDQAAEDNLESHTVGIETAQEEVASFSPSVHLLSLGVKTQMEA